MSDFEEICTAPTGYKDDRWRVSALGNWIFIFSEWKNSEGDYRISKTKKGNPVAFKLTRDQLPAFLDMLSAVRGGSASHDDEAPF